jgi:hypothetical protein
VPGMDRADLEALAGSTHWWTAPHERMSPMWWSSWWLIWDGVHGDARRLRLGGMGALNRYTRTFVPRHHGQRGEGLS